MVTESEILRRLERQPHRAAGYKQLVRELSLRGEERRQLEEMLADMVRRGRLIMTSRDHYTLASEAANRNLVVGTISTHRDGYGFVSATDRKAREALGGDIFIPPGELAEAMHGDQVLVELRGARSEGRPEGRVLRVMQRAHATVVGVFHYGTRLNTVRPLDDKVSMDIVIPAGMEVPTAEEQESARAHRGSTRDRVIGEEARQADWDDLDGVVVDVEIIEWPSATQNPRGRVIEILGYEDDFGVDVEIIIRKHHLPHRFPLAVLDEAQSIDHTLTAREVRGRRDFRALPIVTIDGETARDFDDAVTVCRLAGGNYQLQVHIADVAHYVRPGSPIDLEACIRGTSVYFPDRAIPMLPVELSTDVCSLRPKVDRLVMSCIMEIDARGEIVSYEICPGIIRSSERMTYTDMAALLDGDKGDGHKKDPEQPHLQSWKYLRERYAPLLEVFENMRDLAVILNEKRRRRGSIDFDLPEPVIEFDEYGLMKGVSRSERNFAHRLIEEFMLAANETVSTYLEQKGVGSLYRIHEAPDPKRVYDFENLAAAFGYSLGVAALPVQRFKMRADHREKRGTGQRARDVEIPEHVNITPMMYQKLADKIAGKPEERILSYMMLRSLKQARYSELNDGHFALAATTYTHFTSPIRRYPDLIVHRILKAILSEGSERMDGGVPVGTGGHVVQYDRWSVAYADQPRAAGSSPWGGRNKVNRVRARHAKSGERLPLPGPIPEGELRNIAEDSSMAERRADGGERELVEWKKVKFMQDRIGADYPALVTSITKYGMFVELDDLFIEGLVPLQTMPGDRYTFLENTRQLVGQRTKRMFSMGQKVEVLVDRIDPVQKKIQFALLEEEPVKPKRAKVKKKRGK